jgi:PTH1 family peptidyl-tRNA hydrolase
MFSRGSIDWLIVGLGNPGPEYARTRHNVGFLVAAELVERWQLARAKDRFRGRIAEGRLAGGGAGTAGTAEGPGTGARAGAGGTGAAGTGGASLGQVSRRVAVLCPQTFMNDAGRSVGPARGSYKLALDRVLVVHDEIDLPFGEVRSRLGGGLAGHNGLKSIKRELGSADFARVRVGVGRPQSSDPEIVSAYVLGRFREGEQAVEQLIERASDEVERIVLGEQPLG